MECDNVYLYSNSEVSNIDINVDKSIVGMLGMPYLLVLFFGAAPG